MVSQILETFLVACVVIVIHFLFYFENFLLIKPQDPESNLLLPSTPLKQFITDIFYEQLFSKMAT